MLNLKKIYMKINRKCQIWNMFDIVFIFFYCESEAQEKCEARGGCFFYLPLKRTLYNSNIYFNMI